MKKLIILKAFLILFMISSSATAQVEFGIKGGLNFNYANNETYLIEGWKKCSICTLESQYFNIFDKKKLVIFLVYIQKSNLVGFSYNQNSYIQRLTVNMI